MGRGRYEPVCLKAASNPEDPEALERIKGVTLDRILPLHGRQKRLGRTLDQDIGHGHHCKVMIILKLKELSGIWRAVRHGKGRAST
jgi:hypothetical protein